MLRGKLASLELFLSSCCIAPFTIAYLLDCLAVTLRAHTEREERLLGALKRKSHEPMESLQQLQDAHENQRTQLAVFHELITNVGAAAWPQVTIQAGCLIKGLREHMAREEKELFPAMERQAAAVYPEERAEAESELSLAGIA